MTNENDIGATNDTGISTQPTDLPNIGPKPGWQTSEGQITAILSAALTVLAFLGFHFSPEQTQNWYDLIHQIFVIVGPIAGIVAMVIPYIISRGKTKSNAINASAAMNIATLGGFGSFGGLLGGSVKDPKTYLNIVKGLNNAGVIPGPAGKIIGGVLGSNTDDSEFESEVTQALQQFDARLKKLEGK